MAKILIVDDEVGIRELLSEILRDEGYDILLAENAGAARAMRNAGRPDLVLLDIWMPDTDGISLLKEWSSTGLLTMPVVMMSGHGTIDSAVEATRVGAVDFLEKPIALQKLLTTVKKALKHEVAAQKPPLTLDAFARSPLLKDLKKRLEQAAAKTSILLLKSASGSIAEICARTLQTPKTPWLDLSASSAPLTQEMLENASGGILFISDLMLLGKLQQKNLVFALDRLDKYKLQLIAAYTRPLSALEEALQYSDFILVMSVNPGFGGQKYIPECTEKIQELKEIIDKEELDVDIQVDGGINDSTLETVMDAGANLLVAGSYVFNGDLASNVQRIQEKIENISERLN